VQYTTAIDIAAPTEQIWSVLVNVERMPEWTASMSHVQRLDAGPFGVGSRVRIKQPRLPAATWQVTELTPLQSFSWTASSGGVITTAEHDLAAAIGGNVTVRFILRQTGLIAPLVGLFTAALSRRYVDAELHGLKQQAESHASGPRRS
jgi:uncharacterized membrane protein